MSNAALRATGLDSPLRVYRALCGCKGELKTATEICAMMGGNPDDDSDVFPLLRSLTLAEDKYHVEADHTEHVTRWMVPLPKDAET